MVEKAEMRGDYGHWLEIPTRWMDNDVYGHVNNVVYYSYFDTVINGYLIEAGKLDIHAGPVIGLCVESQCRYFQPLAFPDRIDAGHKAVNPVDAGEQRRLGVGGRRKPIIGARQFLLRHGPDNIGRHQHHQFGLVVDEVLAAEQRAENRQLVEPRQSVDRLLGLFLDQARHGH